MRPLFGRARALVLTLAAAMTTPVWAQQARQSPCDGITADVVRDIETRFPRTMQGRPAMPVAVATPFVWVVNPAPKCAVKMIVTFNGEIGYSYMFTIERRADRIHLEPVYYDLSNPPPIQLYH